MTDNRVALLVRLAKNNPADRDAILDLLEEIVDGSPPAPSEKNGTHEDTSSVAFPLKIFRTYKGRRYEALLLRNSHIQFNGKEFSSPSSAASSLTGYAENGWHTWKYYDPATGMPTYINRLRGLVYSQ
jgi:hypothetical protein